MKPSDHNSEDLDNHNNKYLHKYGRDEFIHSWLSGMYHKSHKSHKSH